MGGFPGSSIGSRFDAAASRLLFVRTDRLGETLLTLPALHVLRDAFPQSRLIMMVGASLQELVMLDPAIDEVIAEPAIPGPWWQRARALGRLWRSLNVEAILISNPTKAYHLGAWLAGIPIRVGYNRKWGWTLTHRLPDQKAVGERHEVDYNGDLVRALGIAVSTIPSTRLPVSADAAGALSRLLASRSLTHLGRVVAVHPWTSNRRKQWPLERFRQLIERLQAVPGLTVVVIGGPEERAQIPAFFPESPPGVVNLVGQLSLPELAALFQRSRVLVSNDSGPVHLAAAVGTPSIVLFGAVDHATGPGRWGPWGKGHTVIWKPDLEAIEVDDVWRGVQRYLPAGSPA